MTTGTDIFESLIEDENSTSQQSKNTGNCPECDGYGYNLEHDPYDPHINGCNNCPIQEPCQLCLATGWIRSTRILLVEKYYNYSETEKYINYIFTDELPF